MSFTCDYCFANIIYLLVTTHSTSITKYVTSITNYITELTKQLNKKQISPVILSSKNSGNLTNLIETFHEGLILLHALHVVICL